MPKSQFAIYRRTVENGRRARTFRFQERGRWTKLESLKNVLLRPASHFNACTTTCSAQMKLPTVTSERRIDGYQVRQADTEAVHAIGGSTLFVGHLE